ncbi:response regulator [Phyllobacterium phragmitis]|uniref:Response regulator n=1 Tax=Phyllobacterium phragmitis TaxID=2670329 RepID=A0A2S9IRE4_9HYPH|nr:response regulator [Phyllobacterium phragmitis]
MAIARFASAEEFLESGVISDSSCVITDIQIPGMSGIALKRTMDERGCCIPVVMIPARAELGLEEKALASGALCFLRKPIDAKALAECI